VKDHGGDVVVPAMPVGDLGIMAFLTDPGGAVLQGPEDTRTGASPS